MLSLEEIEQAVYTLNAVVAGKLESMLWLEGQFSSLKGVNEKLRTELKDREQGNTWWQSHAAQLEIAKTSLQEVYHRARG